MVLKLKEPCPCCGHQGEPDEIKDTFHFDYQTGTIENSINTVHLTPREADYFQVLLESWPNLIPRDIFIKRVYGNGRLGANKFQDQDTVYMHLSRLRRKIRCLGLDVNSLPHRGWRLFRTNIEEEKV